MNKTTHEKTFNRLRRSGRRILQAAALTLAVTLAMPARAADSRAVKMRVAPAYPELAKRMRITGMVELEATVDASGKVISVKTINGNRMLSPAAEDAVKKWKFEEGDGVSTVNVSINFSM